MCLQSSAGLPDGLVVDGSPTSSTPFGPTASSAYAGGRKAAWDSHLALAKFTVDMA